MLLWNLSPIYHPFRVISDLWYLEKSRDTLSAILRRLRSSGMADSEPRPPTSYYPVVLLWNFSTIYHRFRVIVYIPSSLNFLFLWGEIKGFLTPTSSSSNFRHPGPQKALLVSGHRNTCFEPFCVFLRRCVWHVAFLNGPEKKRKSHKSGIFHPVVGTPLFRWGR